MQVSWIDPDEVRDLLKQLEGPKQAATASAWEVHTLPSAPLATSASEPLMSETSESPPETLPHHADAPLGDGRTGPANAELWRIRERLRVLRDKAQSAGILSRTPQETAPVAVSEPGTSPQPSSSSVEKAEEAPPPVVEAAALPPEPSPAVPIATPSDVPQPSPDPVVQWHGEAFIDPPVHDAEQQTPVPPRIESPFELVEPPPAVYEPLFGAPTPPATEPVVEPVSEEPGSPAAEPVDMAPPFAVANLGLSERLNAVAEWVCARLGTREVLLVDDYGDVLWGAQGQTALVLSAMMAWHSAQRASASATCIDPDRIDKPLPPDRALTVLPLRTRYGVVSLAVILGKPVDDTDAIAIRQALAIAVEGTAS